MRHNGDILLNGQKQGLAFGNSVSNYALLFGNVRVYNIFWGLDYQFNFLVELVP